MAAVEGDGEIVRAFDGNDRRNRQRPCFKRQRISTENELKYPNLPEFTEVFDLTADPYEIKNLASDATLTAKLDAELERMMKTVNYTAPANANKPLAE